MNLADAIRQAALRQAEEHGHKEPNMANNSFFEAADNHDEPMRTDAQPTSEGHEEWNSEGAEEAPKIHPVFLISSAPAAPRPADPPATAFPAFAAGAEAPEGKAQPEEPAYDDEPEYVEDLADLDVLNDLDDLDEAPAPASPPVQAFPEAPVLSVHAEAPEGAADQTFPEASAFESHADNLTEPTDRDDAPEPVSQEEQAFPVAPGFPDAQALPEEPYEPEEDDLPPLPAEGTVWHFSTNSDEQAQSEMPEEPAEPVGAPLPTESAFWAAPSNSHEQEFPPEAAWGIDTGKLTITTDRAQADELFAPDGEKGGETSQTEAPLSGGNTVRFEIFLSPDQLSCLFRALVATQHSMMTLREAASYLRIPAGTLEQLAVESKIPALLLEGRWRFPKSGIDEWVMLQSFRDGEASDAA